MKAFWESGIGFEKALKNEDFIEMLKYVNKLRPLLKTIIKELEDNS